MSDKMTTIAVSTKTRDRLAEIGGKSETFDDIINRVINSALKLTEKRNP